MGSWKVQQTLIWTNRCSEGLSSRSESSTSAKRSPAGTKGSLRNSRRSSTHSGHSKSPADAPSALRWPRFDIQMAPFCTQISLKFSKVIKSSDGPFNSPTERYVAPHPHWSTAWSHAFSSLPCHRHWFTDNFITLNKKLSILFDSYLLGTWMQFPQTTGVVSTTQGKYYWCQNRTIPITNPIQFHLFMLSSQILSDTKNYPNFPPRCGAAFVGNIQISHAPIFVLRGDLPEKKTYQSNKKY